MNYHLRPLIGFLVITGIVGCSSIPWSKDSPKKQVPEAASVPALAEEIRNRDAKLQKALTDGENAIRLSRLDDAEKNLKQALEIDPLNDRARDGMTAINRMRRHATLNTEAQKLLEKGEIRSAEIHAREVLAENAKDPIALAIMASIYQKRDESRKVTPTLKYGGGPISFGFREAPVKNVFEALSRSTGINFILDKDISSRQTVTIYIMSGLFPEVLDSLLASNQLQKKVLNENTVLVFPNTSGKLKEYQELELRSFYLANADVKQVAATLKSMLDIRDVQLDERANLIMLRENPDIIKLAERIISAMDVSEPEVKLDLQVLEVSSNTLSELGVKWPTTLSVVNDAGVNNTTIPLARLIGDNARLASLKSENFVIGSPLPSAQFSASGSDINILANPTIRVKNKEKAKIHVGDRIPIFTSNTTTTTSTNTSFSVSYVNVGLSLEVAPQVNIDDEVSIVVSLDVSSLGEKTTKENAEAYRIGTRNATTTLKLKDGETQVLAGLISDSETKGTVDVPGLGKIPVLGRLFSSHKDERRKTEVLLVITPHVIRNYPSTQSAVQSDLMLGTPAAMGRPTAADVTGGGGGSAPSIPPSLLPFVNPGAGAQKQPTQQQAPVATPAPATPAPSAPATPSPAAPASGGTGIPGLPN